MANLSNINNKLLVGTNGEVRIGDTATVADVKLRVKQTAQQWTAQFVNTDSSVAYGISIDTSASSYGVAGTLQCYTNSGGGFIVRNDSRVGIGTSSPQRLLQLRSTNEATGIFLERTSNYGFVQYNQIVGSVETYHLGFVNNNTFSSDILVANESGKVGIGTDSPVGKTDIFVGASGYTNNVTTLPVGTWSFANGSGSNSYPSLVSKSNATGAGMTLVAATDDGAPNGMDFNIRKGDNTDFSTLTTNGFTFSRFGTVLTTILRNGNVGIGTTSPGTYLQLGDYPSENISQTSYPDIPSEHMLHITAPEISGHYGGGISFGENAFTAANIVVRDAGAAGSLDLCFGTGSANGMTERLRITSNGSVYNAVASNTHFGLNALSSTTTADESTAFGNFALRAQQTGRNTAVGFHTLQDLSTGNYNTVVGGEAGENITVGNFNVGMGSFALRNATDISNVTAIGYKALYDLTTGGSNTAVGGSAGENLTTGGSNTLIGANAGDSMTDGSENVVIGRLAYQAGDNIGNTVIGYQAGYGANQTGAIFIGWRAGWTNNANSVVFIGNEAGRNNTTGSGNCFIGTDAGYAVTTGFNNSFVGISAGTYQTGSYNTSLGNKAMFGVTNASSGSYNTGVGYYAGYGNKGENNTCIGAIAGRYMQTGGRNTIVGSQAADNQNITGDDNSVLGFTAGQNITSGHNNTLIGSNAGNLIQSAFENIYIGYHSGKNATGGNYNTAVGSYSLRQNTTADRCTAIGRSALINVTSGDFNTALGMSAGESQTQGLSNVYLGYNSGTTHTSGSNCIIAGAQSQPSSATVSNEITLGNASIGTLRCQVTSITSLSDERDKTNIKDSNYGLNVINSLRPVTFDWNNRDESENKGKKDVGFIAQELQKIDDESLRLVYSENPEKLEATYGRLIPVLVKAIQELKAEIELLKSK